MSELIGLIVGLILTLFIFSYVYGDNVLYRLAVHLLIGVSAGYATVVAVREVFIPIGQQIQADPTAPTNVLWFVPLGLVVLLALKWVRPIAWISNSAVAMLVGVGAAVALVGAITGTLLPQVLARSSSNGLLNLLGAFFTVCALLYFQFTGRANEDGENVEATWLKYLTQIGQAVLMITFGALFASLLSSSLVLLSERILFFIDGFSNIVGQFLS